MSLNRDNAFGALNDDIYAVLVDAHKNLSDEESHRFNARLLLLFANHIADIKVIEEAIDIAKTRL